MIDDDPIAQGLLNVIPLDELKRYIIARENSKAVEEDINFRRLCEKAREAKIPDRLMSSQFETEIKVPMLVRLSCQAKHPEGIYAECTISQMVTSNDLLKEFRNEIDAQNEIYQQAWAELKVLAVECGVDLNDKKGMYEGFADFMYYLRTRKTQ